MAELHLIASLVDKMMVNYDNLTIVVEQNCSRAVVRPRRPPGDGDECLHQPDDPTVGADGCRGHRLHAAAIRLGASIGRKMIFGTKR